MKVGIMQPYFFPYIGYWQLINVVDKFVILDDVNYITRGYINRNSILLNGKPYRFTIPVKKASQNKLIMETEFNFGIGEKEKFLQTIQMAYKKAPYYKNIMPLITEIIKNPESDVTNYIRFSLEKLMAYLHIHTEVLLSSQIKKNQELRAEERIIEICRKLNADTYINPCGGRKLYNQFDFEQNDMQLFFLDTKSDNIVYDQKQDFFVQNLSIIDVMMFNSVKQIQELLEEYELNE